MKQSKRRQKHRARQLAGWESVLRRALVETRRGLGMAADEEIPDDFLIVEVLRLADPYTYDGLDAVVPAPRVDLAMTWFRTRLLREADTEKERMALARSIAPAPDFDPPGRYRFGVTRAIVERAVRYYARREDRAP